MFTIICFISCIICIIAVVIMDKENTKLLRKWKETLNLAESIIDFNKRLVARNNDLVAILKDKGLLEEEE